jgi:hypothetical protein
MNEKGLAGPAARPFFLIEVPPMNEPVTLAEYGGFQKAYDFFNVALFEGALPNLLVTLQRKANTRGYFSPDRFSARDNDRTVHELALNPNTFDGSTDDEMKVFL